MKQLFENQHLELRVEPFDMAEPTVGFLDLLVQLRKAAETVPPAELVERLTSVDARHLDATREWAQLDSAQLHIYQAAELSDRVTNSRNAAQKRCPYTAEQYDAAVAKAGPKQRAIAAELGVDPKTLRKYRRPAV